MTACAARETHDPEARAEGRDRVVHVVEYGPFPRRRASETRRVGFTQDCSAHGLGLDLDEPLRRGELLRVTLRDIDGEASRDGLARVVWCRLGDLDRYRAGLALLPDASPRPRRRRAAAVRGPACDRIGVPDLLD